MILAEIDYLLCQFLGVKAVHVLNQNHKNDIKYKISCLKNSMTNKIIIFRKTLAKKLFVIILGDYYQG